MLNHVPERLFFRALMLLALFSVVWPYAFGQSTAPSTAQSERDLLLALLKAPQEEPTTTAALLKENAPLVTPTLWRELSDLAVRTYYQNQIDRCLLLYDIARQVALQLNDRKLLATTYYNLGRTYSGLSQYEKAKAAYLNSQEAFAAAGLKHDLVYILSDLGTIEFILEDYVQAKEYSEESLRLAEGLRTSTAPPGAWPDEYGIAAALATLGELAMREGNLAQAVDELQRSVAIYQQLNRGTSYYDYYLAEAFAALGRIYTTAGDHAQALALLNKALTLAKTLSQPERIASLLNSLGFLYLEQEDYDQATAYFNQSLQGYRGQENRKEAARVLLNLGVVQQRQGNYDQALEIFRQSLKEAEAVAFKDGAIAAREGIGVVLTSKGMYAAALETLSEGVRLARDTNDQMRQTEFLWRQAEAYYAWGKYAEAASLSQTALTLARRLRLPKLSYLAATTLGQSYAKQEKLDLASQTFVQAIDNVEQMREKVAGTNEEVELFFQHRLAPYHALIDLFIKQYRPMEALLYAERAKGRVLLDVLSGGKVDLAKALTASEKKESERLNQRISDINDLIRSQEANRTPAALTSLYTQLDAARLDYRSFEDALYVSHPELRVRSGRTAALTTAEMNSLNLDRDCAYLEYVVSKDGVRLFVLTINQADGAANLQAYPLEIRPDELTAKVNQFHDRLANRHPDYAAASQELYSLLVKPAAGQITNKGTICIIPDGVLWNLPFQALMSSNDHYLLADHAVYYAPSLSVLREMTKERAGKEKSEASLIAFGNPVIGKDAQRNEELCPLPEAETEVTKVAKNFRSGGSKVFIGREASEKTFRALAPTYSTIHLATHGVIDNRQPLYSHLLLTKTDGDPENDGLLEAREIMNMNLRADLAILSACETANGRISPGEGVMGMSWAFFVAGTRSMLVSQWKVNSDSTSRLMVDFYKNLMSNKDSPNNSKASALRHAALTMMSDHRYRHPFYWAGFVVVGGDR
jgi:CHAT domain-containing protein/Tfp pilus assembly protein PilF